MMVFWQTGLNKQCNPDKGHNTYLCFLNYPWKHMFWLLIRIALAYPKHISRNVRKCTFWQERPKKTENNITKIYLCNFDPLKPHFYIVQLGFTGVYIIFLISAQNIDCGYPLEPPLRGKAVLTSTHNLCFGQNYEKYQNFLSENFPFLFVKFSIYLNRRVFVMMHTCAVRFLFLLSTWRHFAPLAI